MITATCAKSLDKLQLNDASLTFQPETSQALGFGFRAGFLGLFHMEIIQERIEREYDLDVLFTAPSVEYEVVMIDGETIPVDSPAELPDEIKGRGDPRTVDEHRDHHAHRLLRSHHGSGDQAPRHLQAAGISRAASRAARL